MGFEPTTPNTKIEIGLQSKQRYVKTITFTSGHISFHMWPGYETKYLQLTPRAFKDYSFVGREKKLYSNVASCLNVYTSLAIYTQELSIKTRELLNNLSSLAPEGEKITLDLLHARKLTPATETFLYSLASAEGLAQL